MNISLRQVKMNTSQAMFITSTGTVLFTSHVQRDQLGYRLTTTVTSVDHQGSIVDIGFIKWNENTGDQPYLCVGAHLMELRTMRDDSFSTIFRGSDGRVYRWNTVNDVAILSAASASFAPIAVAYDDAQSSSMAEDPVAGNIDLCIRPTGFHLLREIVATFILFDQLRERACPDYGRKTQIGSNPFQGTRILSGERRVQLIKDDNRIRAGHVLPTRLYDIQNSVGGHTGTWLRSPSSHITADLTGQLSRRHKNPSAYGGFGDIWKCDWVKDSRVIEVAVKVMRTNLTGSKKEAEGKRICRELKVWVRLEHECVLPLYGITFDFGQFPAMVCPWLEGGTLSRYLEHHEDLPLHARLQLLSDIAEGLHYLHGCGIVHGDLTGSNVLIKDNGKACLSDFGLSRIFMDATGSSYLTSTVRGSLRWAAPELFGIDEEQHKEPLHAVPSPQSDVYSFGSTMLQVLTGKVPYHYCKSDAQVVVVLSRGLRPARPDEPPIDDSLWKFMQRCWSGQSRRLSKNLRPSVEEVVDFLAVAKTRCSQDYYE